ncbi:MAG: hypothetical protein P8182_12275 [Deltaproteobacteria bacterium]
MIRNLLELRRILRCRKLGPDELEALRVRKLRAVIHNAYEHVPYYGSLFKSAGIAPEDIRTVEDLKNIPVTTKDDLRAAGVKKTVADWVDVSECIRTLTSGATGKPFEVYRTPSEYMTTRLHITAALLTYGFGLGDRLVSLEGDDVVLVPFHRRLRFFRRELIASGLPVDELIRQLVNAKPTMIWAMPAKLRAVLLNATIPLSDLMPLKTIITWGQAVDLPLKTRLQHDLSVDLFSCYGANEAVLVAWECPSRDGLHINMDHVILECCPDETIGEADGVGISVVTSLDSLAMPFIRYRLGDLCSFSLRECSCGSSLPRMEHPVGRDWDMVRLPSGKVLHAHKFDYILRAFPGIFQWQVIQETRGHFLVRLVLDGPTPEDMVPRIRSQFAEYLREPVTVEIEFVDGIDDGSSKPSAFLSKVPSMSSTPKLVD